MAIKSGFFNSVAGDRKYDAEDINKFFDGVITEGILEAIGDSLEVIPSSGLQIAIGSGKAWFLKSWIENTADAFLTLSDADVTYGRIDIIALDFDKSDQVRENDIVIVEGTPAASPVAPSLIDTATHLQMPLAHIQVDANETVIQASDITSKVGTVDCPYSSGITDLVVSVDDVTIEIVSNDLQLKDGGITAIKIATNAVGSDELADNAVDTASIQNGSVTNAKIRDGAASSVIGRAAGSIGDVADINATANNRVLARAGDVLSFQQVVNAMIANDAINADKIENDAIDSEHYAPLSIDNGHINTDAVNGDKIANNSIDSDHYVNASIENEHLAANIVDDDNIGLRVPMFKGRRGGSSTVWETPGTTNYTPGAVMMLGGSAISAVIGSGNLTAFSVSFSPAFSYAPIVLVSVADTSDGNGAECHASVTLVTTTNATIQVFNNSGYTASITVHWIAIGSE